MSLRYDVVVVTRNRPKALVLSIPLLLAQHRRPERIIVVDSSDDHQAIRDVITKIPSDIEIQIIAAPPGLTRQRNIGLREVKSEVVFFPDDDSLVYPDAMTHIMRVYERDTGQIIGGVCSAEAMEPPVPIPVADTYKLAFRDRLKKRVASYRYKLEDKFFRDPYKKYGHQKVGEYHLPDWLREENAIPVPYMTGFRMSFRTSVISKRGFDETLSRYALCEDVQACFDVLDTHALVGARNARIYHHKSPERRENGARLGAMHILNKVYVLAMHDRNGVVSQQQLRRYLRYKLLQYRSSSHGVFGKQRLAGATEAYRVYGDLLGKSSEEIRRRYKELADRLYA